MSLDRRVLDTLRVVANSSADWVAKDNLALSYINRVRVNEHSPFLRAAYIRYYFDIKSEYKLKEKK